MIAAVAGEGLDETHPTKPDAFDPCPASVTDVSQSFGPSDAHERNQNTIYLDHTGPSCLGVLAGDPG